MGQPHFKVIQNADSAFGFHLLEHRAYKGVVQWRKIGTPKDSEEGCVNLMRSIIRDRRRMLQLVDTKNTPKVVATFDQDGNAIRNNTSGG